MRLNIPQRLKSEGSLNLLIHKQSNKTGEERECAEIWRRWTWIRNYSNRFNDVSLFKVPRETIHKSFSCILLQNVVNICGNSKFSVPCLCGAYNRIWSVPCVGLIWSNIVPIWSPLGYAMLDNLACGILTLGFAKAKV